MGRNKRNMERTHSHSWSCWLAGCAQPKLHYSNDDSTRAIVDQCSHLLSKYCSPVWATNAHTHTLMAAVRGVFAPAQYKRELLIGPDGGTVGLDWHRADAKLPDTAPILLILHGVTGCSNDYYCKCMCVAAFQHGWRPVVLNFRGCGGLKLTSPRIYSAVHTDDVHLTMVHLHARYPRARVAAVGYSLGSMILTKYVAEADSGHWPGGSLLCAAAMISNPFNLRPLDAWELDAAQLQPGKSWVRNFLLNPRFLAQFAYYILKRPWDPSWLYPLGLAQRMRAYIYLHREILSSHEDLDWHAIDKGWIVQHFDDSLVTKLFGYGHMSEYYEEARMVAYVPRLRTPALFLVSADDPFLGTLPVEEVESTPGVVLAVTKRGGHLGFLSASKTWGSAWMDDVVLQFIQAAMTTTPQEKVRNGKIQGKASEEGEQTRCNGCPQENALQQS